MQHGAQISIARLLSIAGLALAAFAAPASETRTVGGALHVLDLNGRPVDPFQEPGAKATVFLFVRSDCPISNRYAPEVGRLQEKFAPRGVIFWLVYVDPDEPAGQIRRHMQEYDYRFDALRDPGHTLVKMTGVGVTPEAAVFADEMRMVYRGRIDNRYVDFGKTRPAPTERDLAEALEAVLAGRPVPNPTTPAVGCYIPDLQ